MRDIIIDKIILNFRKFAMNKKLYNRDIFIHKSGINWSYLFYTIHLMNVVQLIITSDFFYKL